MFKSSISSTMMTSDAANIFFQNITGEAYGSDQTFLATLRALIAPRLPEGESVHLSFGRSDYNAAIIAETPVGRMVEMVCGNMYLGNGQIYVHSLANRDEANNVANIELLKQQFCNVYKGWQYLDKISNFYQKSFKVICFINPEMKSASLFVEQLNLQKLHYLQMSTLAFLPWYFNAENGIDEIEMKMLKSLRLRNSTDWESCIAEIASRYDFESGRIKALLSGYEIRFEKMECDRVRRNISRIDSSLKDLDRQYVDCLKRRDDLCIRLLGLERRVENGEQSELMEYFLCNKKLFLEDVDGTRMYFAVHDYLSYFDEDAATSYINNYNSYFYRNCNSSVTQDGMQKLLQAIFVDQTIRIRFCAAYSFDMNGEVKAQYMHNFGPEFRGYYPNPHIDRYECMGNYKRVINEALSKRDYVTALEQCIASAKSLNFHDSTVMGTFAEQFTSNGGSSYKALELPDGQVVSPKDAIKWMEEQEAAAQVDAAFVAEVQF